MQETPKAIRHGIGTGIIPKESPAQLRKPAFMEPESVKKAPKLPGFYNAFATSTPARNPKPNLKGKVTGSPHGPAPSQFNSSGIAPGPPSPMSSPTCSRLAAGSDVDMPSDDGPTLCFEGGYGDVEMRPSVDNLDESNELEEVDGPNWREEVG